MSEYQYYEFQALDKPLDERALRYLRRVSSRASITTTSFVNVYNYGDLKADPEALVGKYFDAFLYVANWGAYQLMFRFPPTKVDVKALTPYCVDDALSLTTRGRSVILHFSAEEEGADWVSGEGDTSPPRSTCVTMQV